MKIGIYDINESSCLNYKERLDIYKSVGFTSVGVYLDERYMADGENYLDIISYARKIGLRVNQVHIDYKISNLIADDNSQDYFVYVKNKIDECVNLDISYVVLHASKGDDAPLITDIGINKLRELMKEYVNKNVFLCFENVRDNRNLKTIIDSSINNVGVCYDLGHAHCYDDEYRLLSLFKNDIKCSHLHNNYGKDSHNSLFEGEIKVKDIIPILNENNIDNCLEVFPLRGVILTRQEFIDFIKDNYLQYCQCAKS